MQILQEQISVHVGIPRGEGVFWIFRGYLMLDDSNLLNSQSSLQIQLFAG